VAWGRKQTEARGRLVARFPSEAGGVGPATFSHATPEPYFRLSAGTIITHHCNICRGFVSWSRLRPRHALFCVLLFARREAVADVLPAHSPAPTSSMLTRSGQHQQEGLDTVISSTFVTSLGHYPPYRLIVFQRRRRLALPWFQPRDLTRDGWQSLH